MPLFTSPNSGSCSENGEHLMEAWSPAARAAAAASRKSRGSGKAASTKAGRIAYAKAGGAQRTSQSGKSYEAPHRSLYAAEHSLKHFRSPGLHSTHFKDPTGRLHVHDSKSNTWKLGKERAKGYKLGSKKSQAARKASKQRAWNASYD